MTSAELKSLLLSIASAIDAGAKIYSNDVDQGLIKMLSGLDDKSITLIAAILQVPEETLKAIIPDAIKLLNMMDILYGTSEYERISGFCRGLANKPILLAMISRML